MRSHVSVTNRWRSSDSSGRDDDELHVRRMRKQVDRHHPLHAERFATPTGPAEYAQVVGQGATFDDIIPAESMAVRIAADEHDLRDVSLCADQLAHTRCQPGSRRI